MPRVEFEPMTPVFELAKTVLGVLACRITNKFPSSLLRSFPYCYEEKLQGYYTSSININIHTIIVVFKRRESHVNDAKYQNFAQSSSSRLCSMISTRGSILKRKNLQWNRTQRLK
jgi:hypothetical protein